MGVGVPRNAGDLHQPFERGPASFRRRQGCPRPARLRADVSRLRQGDRARHRRGLGEAALRGADALPCGDPGAHAGLARLQMVLRRTDPGARARQGDPAGAVRSRSKAGSSCRTSRRSTWSTGTRAGWSGWRIACARSPTSWPAASRSIRRARPIRASTRSRRRTRRSISGATRKAAPCSSGSTRGARKAARASWSSSGRRARASPHCSRRACCRCLNRRRAQWVISAGHPAREGTDGGARQGAGSACRQTGDLARLARDAERAGRRCGARALCAGRAHRRSARRDRAVADRPVRGMLHHHARGRARCLPRTAAGGVRTRPPVHGDRDRPLRRAGRPDRVRASWSATTRPSR